MANAKPKPTEIVFPARVVIDSREQLPYSFASILSDARTGRLPMIVSTVRAGLASGDYSLEGMESMVAIERKSLADLFNTLGAGRARFSRELQRLSSMRFAAVIVEAEWSDILTAPPARSQLSPKTVYRSVIAWQQRYPAIHWWMLPSRSVAERTTFRILERFWKNHSFSVSQSQTQRHRSEAGSLVPI